MKSWYVRYGCECGEEDCVVLCMSEERVKAWAIEQSIDYYEGYDHGEFESLEDMELWEEDNRFWFVEPYCAYDNVHFAAQRCVVEL